MRHRDLADAPGRGGDDGAVQQPGRDLPADQEVQDLQGEGSAERDVFQRPGLVLLERPEVGGGQLAHARMAEFPPAPRPDLAFTREAARFEADLDGAPEQPRIAPGEPPQHVRGEPVDLPAEHAGEQVGEGVPGEPAEGEYGRPPAPAHVGDRALPCGEHQLEAHGLGEARDGRGR